MVEDIFKRDPFLKNHTFLVFDYDKQDYIRWVSDKSLFFAGSKEDALIGIEQYPCEAVEVIKCPDSIQKEYEQLIKTLIKNDGL
jgi:hypothetical protein